MISPPPFVGHYNTSSNSSWNVSIVDLEPHHNNEKVLCYTFCDEVLPLLQNLNFLRYIKWGKALYKMRKSEKTTFQWPKVSRLLTMWPRHRPDFRTVLRFLFWAPEVPVLRVRKSHFYCFSSLRKSHFRCPKQKSETCSEIPSVTWLRGKKFAHFRLLESGFLAFSHFI